MAYGSILGQTVEIPQPVNTVASGNMNAVTSNAVYQALQNLPAGVQIATGSYVGTGTYGASNPNSLTFEFEPKILFINAYKTSGRYSYATDFSAIKEIVIGSDGALEWHSGTDSFNIRSIVFSGNSVNWYGANALNQLNESGYTYYYTVIG